jgi:Na+/H+ antiporter NhaD/arsenite permease-like protein
LFALGPIALVGLAIARGIIVYVYRAEFDRPWPEGEIELTGQTDYRQLRKCLIVIGLMLIAFVVGAPIALAAIIAAAALLVTRRTEPETVFARVDWPLLVLFSGLFVVAGVLDYTHLSGRLFVLLVPATHGGVAALAATAAVLSNLISNVPAVLLFRTAIPSLADPRQAWLTLAMASTLADNLTLLGSVANLIVAETARASGVRLSFREYLRAGVRITLANLGVGILWLSLVRS